MKHTLTIDRALWYRGESGTDSRLLISEHPDSSQNGKMCCLGFACRQLAGLTEDDIDCVDFPRDLKGTPIDALQIPFDGALWSECPEILRQVGTINDQSDIAPDHREASLKEIFATLDIELKFIN